MAKPVSVTRTYRISFSDDDLRQRFDNFLSMLHFNGGHSSFFGMEFDGDGADNLKVDPPPKADGKVVNKYSMTGSVDYVSRSSNESLIERVVSFLDEAQIDDHLAMHGYSNPQPGAEGHVTFTKLIDPRSQVLVDFPGGEWHHMVDGVILRIGKIDDNSLNNYLHGATQ